MRLKCEIAIDLFDENSVIIFATLLKPIGYMKRVTSSYTKIFGIKATDVNSY